MPVRMDSLQDHRDNGTSTNVCRHWMIVLGQPNRGEHDRRKKSGKLLPRIYVYVVASRQESLRKVWQNIINSED